MGISRFDADAKHKRLKKYTACLVFPLTLTNRNVQIYCVMWMWRCCPCRTVAVKALLDQGLLVVARYEYTLQQVLGFSTNHHYSCCIVTTTIIIVTAHDQRLWPAPTAELQGACCARQHVDCVHLLPLE